MVPDVTEGLTAEEEATLVELIGKTGNQMSAAFFNTVAKKFVLVAFEAVILRWSKDHDEVLLTARSEGDLWEGMLSCPGTILRATDTSLDDAKRRLEEQELKILFHSVRFMAPMFVDASRSRRGPHLKLIHLCHIDQDPPVLHRWVNARTLHTELPDRLIASQYDMIEQVLKLL